MNHRIVHACLALLLCAGSSGCIIAIGADTSGDWDWSDGEWWNKNGVVGSGVEKTDPRTVPDFQRIEIGCSADVSVRVGSATSVAVTGDENIVPHVRTDVVDGVLVIKMDSGSYRYHRSLKVHATVPTLSGVRISGSSDVEVTGLSGPAFDVSVSGSGDITASGEVDALSAAVSGSGDLKLFGLKAHRATVQIAGSGDVSVSASDALSASVSGSGDVHYRGSPTVTKSVAGSGGVHRVDP